MASPHYASAVARYILADAGSADISGNLIEKNTDRELSLLTNVAARLSNAPFHAEQNLL